jgi:hypothetical protein
MYYDLVCVETFGCEHRYTGPGVEAYTHCSTTSKAATTGHDARRLLVRIADELAEPEAQAPRTSSYRGRD